MNYSRNVRDKWLLLSTLDYSNPNNHRLMQNIYNDRIIVKLNEIRINKPDYFKNINVEMLHDLSLLNTSRKWKYNRYVGKYKVTFLLKF